MHLARARAIVDHVLVNAPGPVSVFVADTHGELVAAATMDGAAPDPRLSAQRKTYTAARSDATSTREIAEKARADPGERASFDPFFTFFLGGISRGSYNVIVPAATVSRMSPRSIGSLESHTTSPTTASSTSARCPAHRPPPAPALVVGCGHISTRCAT